MQYIMTFRNLCTEGSHLLCFIPLVVILYSFASTHLLQCYNLEETDTSDWQTLLNLHDPRICQQYILNRGERKRNKELINSDSQLA